MQKPFVIDAIFFLAFFLVSWWLMAKSFGYDAKKSQFRVARHEVGDFGLHISLIRSFVEGENTPVQSPFFPGQPLVYHYGVDWLTAQFVRAGIPIDYAFNGISAFALALLLYVLYSMGGIFAPVLFLLPSNLSFVEMVTQAHNFWRFGDYIHKGPFDGSVITIYTTLSPFLNQRHLIVGMAIGLTIIWLASRTAKGWRTFAVFGIIIGLTTRIHIVIAVSTAIVVAIMLLGERKKELASFAATFFVAAAGHVFSLREGIAIQWLNPGYLAPRPLTFGSWLSFWVANLGVLIILIPIALRRADGKGRRILLGAGVIFFVANSVQVSYRMEHNHSLINYAVVLALPSVAGLLARWLRTRRFVAICALFLATISGLFNLMVVKNDYQAMIDDVLKSGFMRWVQTTPKRSVFVSKHVLYDPVTIAGRKNYLGMEYYVTVMGYDYWGRRKQIDWWFRNFDQNAPVQMKKENIDYIAVPRDGKDFPYSIDEKEVKKILRTAYEDDLYTVYEL